jgi:hypothetical protein
VGCESAESASAAFTAITSHFSPVEQSAGRMTMQRFRLMNIYLGLVLLVLIAAIIGAAWLRPS